MTGLAILQPRRASSRRVVNLITLVLAVALGLGGCGSGSSEPKVASIGSTTAPASSASNGSRSASGSRGAGLTKMLESARCMRGHGITDFPDPSNNGNLSLHVQPGSDLNPHLPKFQAAERACKFDLSGPNMTPAQEASANARAIKYSQCVQSHGIADFPDPNGQGTLTIETGTGDLDPNSTKFQAAEKACQSLDTGFNTNENDLSPPPGSGPGSGDH